MRAASLAAALGAIVGCASGPRAGTVKTLPSAVHSVENETLALAALEAAVGQPLDASADGQAYRVGPGDSLLIAVFRHPELALATYAGSGAGGKESGIFVDFDGTIQFPMLGRLQVAGMTTNAIRELLEQRLAAHLVQPEVLVQVQFMGSIRYYLLGEFESPGIKTTDRPLTLLEALALGGSVRAATSSLSRAYLVRDRRKLPINLLRLLQDGDMQHNIRLRSGDTIYVPDNASDRVYVFGGTVHGTVPFIRGELTLLQALAQAGMGFREQTIARLDAVRIIRSEADRGQLFVVDAERILKGEAAPFYLAPGDIVYLPPTGITSWNQAIEQLLPSLQLIQGLLSPFVLIRFFQN